MILIATIGLGISLFGIVVAVLSYIPVFIYKKSSAWSLLGPSISVFGLFIVVVCSASRAFT